MEAVLKIFSKEFVVDSYFREIAACRVLVKIIKIFSKEFVVDSYFREVAAGRVLVKMITNKSRTANFYSKCVCVFILFHREGFFHLQDV